MSDELAKVVQEVVQELTAKDYKNSARYAPHLFELGEKLAQAWKHSTSTPVPNDVFDRLAGLLTLLQRQDPADLMRLGKQVQDLNADLVALSHWITMKMQLTQAAHQLQQQLRQIRSSDVTCYLCKPPQQVKVEELQQHDEKLHQAWRTR